MRLEGVEGDHGLHPLFYTLEKKNARDTRDLNIGCFQIVEMTKNLDSIPYDVLYQIASSLDCHDYIHLSRVNRAINALTKSDSISRNTVKVGLQ
jgi:hypothetical protein